MSSANLASPAPITPDLAERARGRACDPAKRDAIIAAAVRAFFAAGFAGASIEAIAADAGVSKVTIYSRFGTKHALFTAAVECECEKIRDQLLFDEGAGSLRGRLEDFGRNMIAFLARPEMVRFERRIAAEIENEPELGELFLEAGPRRMHRALAGLLERARARGELAFDDPMLTAEQLAAMFKGLADLERRLTGKADADAAERRITAAVDLFLAGYAGR